MGFLRTLLAIVVVLRHTGYRPHFEAVSCFFVVSGFYMAFILSEKYAGRAFHFYLNRWLRIAPAYILVCTSIVAYAIFQTGTYAGVSKIDGYSVVLATLSHLFLIGQDWYQLLVYDIESSRWIFAANSNAPEFVKPFASIIPGTYFLIDPPGWSLGTEFTFYLLAPWIVWRSRRSIIALWFCAFVIFILSLVFLPKQWLNYFFPAQLVFFLGGVISYYWYLDKSKANSHQKNLLFVLGASCIYLLARFISGWAGEALWILYASPLLVAVIAPYLFAVTRNSKIDSWIGRWSYPIYITHIVAISKFVPQGLQQHERLLFVLLVTIALSAPLIYLVEIPIEKLRGRIAVPTVR